MKKITLLLCLISASVFAQLPDVKNFKISSQSLNQVFVPADHDRIYFDFVLREPTDMMKLRSLYIIILLPLQIRLIS